MTFWTKDNNPVGDQPLPPPAQVTVSDTAGASIDQNGKYNPQTQQDGLYANYFVKNRYWAPEHRYMLGVTHPNGFQGSAAAFVQLTAKTLLWMAEWTALKAGATPNIPDTDPGDGSWVYLDGYYEVPQIAPAADGEVPLYRISGRYLYGKKAPNAQTIRDIVFPKPPWMDGNDPRVVPIGKLEKGIITAPGGASSAGGVVFRPTASNAGDIAR